ncbi:S9 family peptidase [Halolamina rubra]|uniref:S9 family peptidase n=1 Tax=Halolamina rubra TaxID=1380430 RepID=UPI000678EB3F|nr:prolyl oligopeptidase family serine peptidase [Halolamina rubra]
MTDETDLLEELASLPTLAHPTASPDGERIALFYDVTGRNQLHVLDVDSGSLTQWSDGEVPRAVKEAPHWSADGERVYFHEDDGGDEQHDVHSITADGETEAVVTLDGQTTLFDVGDDGDTLAVGSTAAGQQNLYVHRRSTGETDRITDHERAAHSGVLPPACDRVAYASNERDDPSNQDTYLVGVDGSDRRRLDVGDPGAETVPVDWGPDGRRLLVSDTSTDLNRCGVYDTDRDEVRWLGDGGAQERPVAFTPDGDRVLAVRTREAADASVVYDLDSGGSRELDLPEGVSPFVRFGNPILDDRRVLVMHTTPTRRPELGCYDLETDEYERLIEAEYGDIDPGRFRDAEFFTVASDGVAETPARALQLSPATELDIECLLYDSGERPSPLIVNPHGGPPVQEKRSFDLYTQFLLTRGYSVLQMNYRGSAGRGRAFREELYGDWGGAEQADVARTAEHVIETRDWIDEERIGVYGGSYGGYSAYWQLVQYPDLYDAGVAFVGVSDLVDMYENTMPHFKTGLMERYLGTPEANPELYEERSPVTHAENLDAPLLIVHGVNDRRVPVSQARIMRDRLEALGYERGEDGEFEYHELGEEGHGSSDIDQKKRTFRLLGAFLDRRLGRPVAAGEHGDKA